MISVTAKNIYRVRVVTSEGRSERLIEAVSTMEAFRQTLQGYSTQATLYSLSARPYHNSDLSSKAA